MTPAPETPPPLPDHLLPVPGGCWTLWRWFGLRGSGFPASQVLRLATPEAANAADALLQAESERDAAQRAALDAIYQEQQGLEREAQGPYRKAQDRIRKGRLPTELPADSPSQGAVARWWQAQEAVEPLKKQFAQQFEAGLRAMSQALYDTAQDPRFQEAVIWQNRRAFHTGIRALLAKPPGSAPRSSQLRQHEELVASYLQRYCTKNDTIGFFGPVGWARVVADGPAMRLEAGADLLAARAVYFENWGIDALAEQFTRNKALLPWAHPRRLPFIYLEGTTLYQPFQPPTPLGAAEALLLNGCDGERSAHAIAADLQRSYPALFPGESQVYRLLEQLQDAGLLRWMFEVPFRAAPEKSLWRLLEGIQPDTLRKPAQAALLKLESSRRAVAKAAGDPEQVDRALQALEETFTQLTRESATRAAGQTYAARTLVYEDCRRDAEVKVGPPLMARLGPPLSLLLESARWFTFRAAQMYRQLFRDTYAGLVRDTGSRVVDAMLCWDRLRPNIARDTPESEGLIGEFQERWASVLALPVGEGPLHYTSEALRPKVLEAFACPGPGWRAARYHCPDVMIAAPSVEAIARGEGLLVMGEIHLGAHTLGGALFVAQHPAPEELFRAYDSDLPDVALTPITPRDFEGMTARTRQELIASHHYRLAFSYDSFGTPREKTIPIGALVAEEVDGQLLLRTRDRQHQFDFVEVFAELIMLRVIDSFQMMPRRAHNPRVTIDEVVVARESWRVPVSELAFVEEKEEAERFLAARRWARARGLPRSVFVKSPVERKPFFVDFDSPVLVNIFAKTMRRTKTEASPDTLVSLSEMLPSLEETWLTDAQGQRYTCEFRFVAVDQPAPTSDS